MGRGGEHNFKWLKNGKKITQQAKGYRARDIVLIDLIQLNSFYSTWDLNRGNWEKNTMIVHMASAISISLVR